MLMSDVIYGEEAWGSDVQELYGDGAIEYRHN
jgi:hypothetical protein